MKNFWNPTIIGRIEVVWDHPLMSALLHMRGAGHDIPDPEIRVWLFPNGFGAQAVTSREFLMIGQIMYDVSAGLAHEDKVLAFNEDTIGDSGLPPEIFGPRERQSPEEVEAYLELVRNYRAEITERKSV